MNGLPPQEVLREWARLVREGASQLERDMALSNLFEAARIAHEELRKVWRPRAVT